MSNTCGFGAMRRPTGWIAWYRLHHHAENRIIRNGRDDILFGTKNEADAAARKEFFKQMNSPIVAESLTGPTTKKAAAKSEANKLFIGGGKVIPIEHKARGRAQT